MKSELRDLVMSCAPDSLRYVNQPLQDQDLAKEQILEAMEKAKQHATQVIDGLYNDLVSYYVLNRAAYVAPEGNDRSNRSFNQYVAGYYRKSESNRTKVEKFFKSHLLVVALHHMINVGWGIYKVLEPTKKRCLRCKKSVQVGEYLHINDRNAYSTFDEYSHLKCEYDRIAIRSWSEQYSTDRQLIEWCDANKDLLEGGTNG
jgi:hypothetical protein